MSQIVDTLVEMGFSKARAELAVSRTKTENIEEAMDWLLCNEQEPPQREVEDSNSETPQPSTMSISNESSSELAEPASPQEAKSIRCDDCGKQFKNQTEVEYHCAKSGHQNFSESTEEKKPLTEDEKKEQLAKIEAKLKQRRLDREAREKQEELEREKHRIKSGKEILEAKKKHEELEMKKIIELRKREKEEEKMARQRVKDQIEQDKLARKAKFGGEVSEIVVPKAAPVAVVKPPQEKNYAEVKLQIRLTNGATLTQTFGAKEPLSAVRLYIDINRTDGLGIFSLMTTFPKKVFTDDDYDKPLDLLGLAPAAVLIVKKT